MSWADYVDQVLEYEFGEDAHLQCHHCGQHLADPLADTLDVYVADGWANSQEWHANVHYRCGYCGKMNDKDYGEERTP